MFRSLLMAGALPYKRQLEYLESTSTQWIDTGIDINSTQKIEIGAQILSFALHYNSGIVGANNNGSRSSGIASPSNTIVQFCAYNGVKSLDVASVSDRIHEYIVDFATSTARFDETSTDISSQGIYAAGTNVYIFALSKSNMGTAKGDSGVSGRVAYARVYADNILARDFIPVLDNNDVPCLYDKVSKQCFYNKGTGQFNYA